MNYQLAVRNYCHKIHSAYQTGTQNRRTQVSSEMTTPVAVLCVAEIQITPFPPHSATFENEPNKCLEKMIKPLFPSYCLWNDSHSFHITLLANRILPVFKNSPIVWSCTNLNASLHLCKIFSLMHQMFWLLGWVLYNLKYLTAYFLLPPMSRDFILFPTCIYKLLILYISKIWLGHG